MKATTYWKKLCGPRFLPDDARIGMAQLPGYTAEYMTVGRGEPIVLVPGLAGGYGLLGRLAALLARDFEVITYELRGEHDPWLGLADTSLATLASDLGHLLDYLRIERPAVLGVSFGAAVALEFAITQPGRLHSLVLQGADTRLRRNLVNAVGIEVLRKVPMPHDSPFVNQFFRLLFGRKENSAGLMDFVTEQCWGTDQGMMVRRLAMLEDVDFEADLDRVRAATLVIAAQHDLFASGKGQRRLVNRIPDAELAAIPKAGHLAFLTRPKQVASLTHDFLQRVRVARA